MKAFKNLYFVRLGLNIICANFGEDWTKFVACVDFLNFFRKSIIAKIVLNWGWSKELDGNFFFLLGIWLKTYMHKRTSNVDPLVALEHSRWRHESWLKNHGTVPNQCAKFQNLSPYGSRGCHRNPSQRKKMMMMYKKRWKHNTCLHSFPAWPPNIFSICRSVCTAYCGSEALMQIYNTCQFM